jgi:hypothetical protein
MGEIEMIVAFLMHVVFFFAWLCVAALLPAFLIGEVLDRWFAKRHKERLDTELLQVARIHLMNRD